MDVLYDLSLNAQGTIVWCQLNFEVKENLTIVEFWIFSSLVEYLLKSSLNVDQRSNFEFFFNDFSIGDFVQGCPL